MFLKLIRKQKLCLLYLNLQLKISSDNFMKKLKIYIKRNLILIFFLFTFIMGVSAEIIPHGDLKEKFDRNTIIKTGNESYINLQNGTQINTNNNSHIILISSNKIIQTYLPIMSMTLNDEYLSFKDMEGSKKELLQKCMELLINRNYSASLIICDEIIQDDPTIVESLNMKAIILYKLELYKEALETIEKAIQLNPAVPDSWNTKAIILRKCHKNDEALIACDQAIQLDLHYPDPWNTKAVILEEHGKYDDALTACNYSIQLDPTYSEPWNTKAVILQNLNDYKGAIIAYNQATQLEPNISMYWNSKGIVLDRLGKHAEAINSYSIAKEHGYIGPKTDMGAFRSI